VDEYTIAAESLPAVYPELEPLFRDHYQAYAARLEGAGVKVSPFNPRLDEYFKASLGGWLKTFVVRHQGAPCGYTNVYVTNDMHNGDVIAQEDVLFVSKPHRGMVGKRLVRFGIDELRKLGVRRLSVSAVTDLRVAKLWKRMGFKEVATQMIYEF
jgi:ribosomal protein S18 acetylase RimI-like enzyme